jgi:uncharacterized protein YktB (UPF0637 family)
MSVETGFEQKFGQLVDAHLNEKLPSLTNYRVGFQVIDKTDEGDRAVGVAAFVVNDVWLYIPVFFLKGDLRGTELIYVKQRDMFVPAADNWISTISERGLEVLGKSKEQGAESDFFAAPENTNIYLDSTEFGKTANFDDNSLIGYDEVCDMFKCHKDASMPIDLPEHLNKLGPDAAMTFANTVLNSEKFANALFHHYDDVSVEKMLKDCVRIYASHQKQAAEPQVQFYTADDMEKAAAELGDTEKGLLLRNDVYVRDTRTNFSKIYEDEVGTGVIQNPTNPGIYDVYTMDGKFKPYIVLTPKNIDECPTMFRQRNNNVGHQVCLIDIDDPKSFICKRNNDVFAKPSTKITEKEIKGLQGGMKASLRSLRDLKDGTELLFVTGADNCIRTRLVKKLTTGDGGLVVAMANTAGTMSKNMTTSNSSIGEIVVEFTGREGRLKVKGDHMFVPSHCRVFTREPGKGENKLALGTPETIYQTMHKQAGDGWGLHRIELFATQGTMELKTASGSTGLMSRSEGLRHMIEDHGIFAGQAMQMWNRAKRNPQNRTSFLIKHAAPYDTTAYGNSERPFMGGPSANEDYGIKSTIQAEGGRALTGPKASDNTSMLPQQAIDKATQAAEAGIKEVFDVAVLEGLVDKTDISELRKDYLKDMIQGMDKVGRMLFLFYWHRDEFEDRYGQEDLTKLEDTLKDVFTSIGDLVLFLKNKTAYSPESADSLFGTLSEDVATA